MVLIKRLLTMNKFMLIVILLTINLSTLDLLSQQRRSVKVHSMNHTQQKHIKASKRYVILHLARLLQQKSTMISISRLQKWQCYASMK